MISVIVPTFNEEKNNSSLFSYLETVAALPNLEVLVIDSQSSDQTWNKIPKKCKKFSIPEQTRADRLNKGILESQYDMVLLHHPRSRLETEAFTQLDLIKDQNIWGGFHHTFDISHPILAFTSFYSNHIRLPYRKIVYLDHCLFFNKNLLVKNYQMPAVDIFEDTLISFDLKRSGKPIRLSSSSTTSSYRFVANGIIRQCLLNAMMKLGFVFGVSPEKMNKIYERKLFLNNLYKTKDKIIEK